MEHRLASRVAHLVASRDPNEGQLLLIDTSHPRRFFTELIQSLVDDRVHRISLLPHNRDEPGSVAKLGPATHPVTVIDQLDYIDDQSLTELLTAIHQGPQPRPLVIASASEARITDFATGTITVPPLSLAETADYVRSTTGSPLPTAQLERLHESSGGNPTRIDEILDSTSPERWLAPVSPNPEALTKAKEHARRGSISTAWVYLADSGGSPETEAKATAGYLALYSGYRRQSLELIKPESTRGAMLALADWRPNELLQRATVAATEEPPGSAGADEAQALIMLARTVVNGTLPRSMPRMHTATGTQRLDLMRGWTSLAHDDPLSARAHLRMRPTDTPLLRLWQDAWLARTLYVLGDLAGAAATVERGLASAEVRGVRLLEPLLLWTGAQTAAMRGDAALGRYYFSRLRIDQDAFLLQRLPAAMGRMIVTASGTDLKVALRAGADLSRIVSQTDTQHPGFWPWEDIYAQTLLRAGRIEDADELVTGAEARHIPSGLVSLNAKNAVARAGIQLQRGQKKEGFATFDGAVDSLEGRLMPTYLARVLFEYGQALRRFGRRSHADEIFTRAGEVYADIGAPQMVRRCASERRASGVGERPETASGLTPQEEQIGLLVADGASNKSVAQQLTLSTKTVEYHLTSIYKKLGVTNRKELRETFPQL